MSSKGHVVGLAAAMVVLACGVYLIFWQTLDTSRTLNDSTLTTTDQDTLSLKEEKEEDEQKQKESERVLNQTNPLEYSIREDFDKHYRAATAGDPGAMVDLSIVAGRCSYAQAFSTPQELRNHYERSFLAHTYDYTSELETFEDCHFVNSHRPANMLSGSWSMDLLNQAAKLGDVAARAFLLHSGGTLEAAELLDAHPEVLKESVVARHTAYQIVGFGPAGQAIEEDNLIEVTMETSGLEAWGLFVCSIDPACSTQQIIEQIESGSSHYVVEDMVSKWQELEKKTNRGESLDIAKAYRGEE